VLRFVHARRFTSIRRYITFPYSKLKPQRALVPVNQSHMARTRIPQNKDNSFSTKTGSITTIAWFIELVSSLILNSIRAAWISKQQLKCQWGVTHRSGLWNEMLPVNPESIAFSDSTSVDN
jgi:hypothetical protein